MKPGAFTFAGTKDRRAKTCQMMSVYKWVPRFLFITAFINLQSAYQIYKKLVMIDSYIQSYDVVDNTLPFQWKLCENISCIFWLFITSIYMQKDELYFSEHLNKAWNLFMLSQQNFVWICNCFTCTSMFVNWSIMYLYSIMIQGGSISPSWPQQRTKKYGTGKFQVCILQLFNLLRDYYAYFVIFETYANKIIFRHISESFYSEQDKTWFITLLKLRAY